MTYCNHEECIKLHVEIKDAVECYSEHPECVYGSVELEKVKRLEQPVYYFTPPKGLQQIETCSPVTFKVTLKGCIGAMGLHPKYPVFIQPPCMVGNNGKELIEEMAKSA
jgi:hypothetical protein